MARGAGGVRPAGARAAANRAGGCTRHDRGHAGAVPYSMPHARSGRAGARPAGARAAWAWVRG